MTAIFAILSCLFLAYANGANDNFKGVATLFGSGTTDYNRALMFGTAATFLGSLVSLTASAGLLAMFTGKGLVPDQVAAAKSFAIAVVLASALAVALATRLGYPVSTTHSLTGALVGAGLLASPAEVNLARLGSGFFAPLLASPPMAMLLAAVAYPAFRFARTRLVVEKESCVCAGAEVVAHPALAPVAVGGDRAVATYPNRIQVQAIPTVSYGTDDSCRERYGGSFLGINAQSALDSAHFLSAGAVSFARGLNDTPKIAALLLMGGTFSPAFTVVSVASAMALGGLLNAKKVADTMAHRVTSMNAGQGFTANLATGAIVIFASKLGLPVSTTHVSCGALFGIGAVTGRARWKTIGSVLLAWLTTLPIAALLGAVFYLAFRGAFV